jgi:hypothetical protein
MKVSKGLLTAIFMTAVAGCAQMDRAPESPAPVTMHDAEVIAKVCKSSAPLLVIDTFRTRKPDYGVAQTGIPGMLFDIDGDGVGDITHGEVVAKVAELSGKTVLTYGAPDGRLMDVTGDALDDVIARLEKNTMPKPSAILIAITNNIDRHWLETYAESVTPDTIGAKREALMRMIEKHWKDNPAVPNHARIKRLNALGVPVIMAAGNGFSHDVYNSYGLAGAILIGSLTHDGRHIAPYSNQSSMVTEYRIGDFIGRRVPGGIDIDNDGKADFPSKMLSGKRSLAETYNGQAAQPLPVTPNGYENGFYRLKDDLAQNNEIDPENPPANLGIYGDYVLKPHMTPFFIENGRWKFDPARDGDKRQVSTITGTSFALPNICSKTPG